MAADWTLPTPGATWNNLVARKACTAVGIGVIAAAQTVFRNALRGPWTSWDGSHELRPVSDGNWGPITQAALWSYAKLKGANDATLAQLKSAAQAKRITLESARVLVWCAYYQPRSVDLDVGGERNTTPQPAVLGALDLAQLTMPGDTKLPTWNIRPSLPPNLDALGAQLPACIDMVDPTTLGGGGSTPTPNTNTNTNTNTMPGGGGGLGALAIGAAALLAVLASKRRKGRR